jgi:hypothetical protein
MIESEVSQKVNLFPRKFTRKRCCTQIKGIIRIVNGRRRCISHTLHRKLLNLLVKQLRLFFTQNKLLLLFHLKPDGNNGASFSNVFRCHINVCDFVNLLDGFLKDIARTDKKTPVIVKCTDDSPHKALVDVLDICYKNGLFSVSVFSM